MRSSAPIERAPRWLWVVYVTLCTALLLVVLTFSFGRDQGIYGVVAERWRHGVWPYEGAWDFKPPGIFLLFVAIQSAFGCGEVAVRVVEVAGLLGLLAGLVEVVLGHDRLINFHGELEQQHLVARDLTNMFTCLNPMIFEPR